MHCRFECENLIHRRAGVLLSYQSFKHINDLVHVGTRTWHHLVLHEKSHMIL